MSAMCDAWLDPRLPASPAQVRRSDVQSAWSGIRPLALDPNATGKLVQLLQWQLLCTIARAA